MINLSLVLQKNDRADDTILMSVRGDETFITYKDGDRTGNYKFSLDNHDAYQYVNDLLRSLAHDADPFDYVQVIPSTGPSILYHIWELENDSMRDVILNQVHTALCGEVIYNRSG